MKAILVSMSLLAVATLSGQAAAPKPAAGTSATQRSAPPIPEVSLEKKERPFEIKGNRFTFSGAAVQLAKKDNPLQLLNPFAPAEYGSGRDNLVAERDPVTGRPAGLKFFSIQF